MRGGAVAARRAHNPKVAGSSPAPATKTGTCKCLFSFKRCGNRIETHNPEFMSPPKGKVGDDSKASTSGQKLSTSPFLKYRIMRYYMQRGHAYRGNTAILRVAGRRSELDTDGDESAQFVGAGVSSHPKVSENNGKFSGDEDIQFPHLVEAFQYGPNLIMERWIISWALLCLAQRDQTKVSL